MAQVVVIGLGKFGYYAAQSLHETGHDVLAVDIHDENIQRIKDHCSRAVRLDAREKERLEALGVAQFDAAVVSLGEAVDVSALVSLYLKELGVPRIITKAGSDDHARLLKRIGVDEIIFPEREAAQHLARRMRDTTREG